MKRYLPAFLLIACAAAFAFGVINLFLLRFEAGDVYPPYSTLRTDPLGAMALYESLGQTPGMTVRRDYSTRNQLPETDRTVYLHAATTIEAWRSLTSAVYDEIQKFLAKGNRLVVTFLPVPVEPPPPPPLTAAERKRQEEEEKRREQKKEPTSKERWGLDLQVVRLSREEGVYVPAPADNVSGLPLPEQLEWHSGIVLRELDSAWTPIYSRGRDPVVVERAYGPGTLVIATDSYFLSNEALLRDRHPDLLAWLIGPNRNVVFDEAHLGVSEQPGVATLIRRYRLHGVIAGLLLLAGLFVWKNAVSLVPRRPQEPGAEYVEGKEAAAGFVNLLRRSIPTAEILAVCFSEWKKSVPGQFSNRLSARAGQAEKAFQAEQARNAGDRDPVRAYSTITTILQKRNP
jgi:hypothetical protein